MGLQAEPLAKGLKQAGNDSRKRHAMLQQAIAEVCQSLGIDWGMLFDPFDLSVQVTDQDPERQQLLLSLQIQVSMLKRATPMPGNPVLERGLQLRATDARRRLARI